MKRLFPSLPFRHSRPTRCSTRPSTRPCLEELEARTQPAVLGLPAAIANPLVHFSSPSSPSPSSPSSSTPSSVSQFAQPTTTATPTTSPPTQQGNTGAGNGTPAFAAQQSPQIAFVVNPGFTIFGPFGPFASLPGNPTGNQPSTAPPVLNQELDFEFLTAVRTLEGPVIGSPIPSQMDPALIDRELLMAHPESGAARPRYNPSGGMVVVNPSNEMEDTNEPLPETQDDPLTWKWDDRREMKAPENMAPAPLEAVSKEVVPPPAVEEAPQEQLPTTLAEPFWTAIAGSKQDLLSDEGLLLQVEKETVDLPSVLSTASLAFMPYWLNFLDGQRQRIKAPEGMNWTSTT